MALALEFQKMGAKNKDELEILKKLKDNEDIKEMLPKTVSRNTKNMNLKPFLLILGHLLRDENINHPCFKESLNMILKSSTAHITMMTDLSMELN